MTRAPRRQLAALIVGWGSGPFAVACARSVLAEWRAADRERADLDLVFVDNASPEDQGPWLAHLADLGAVVVRSQENLGYARGMNLALANARPGAERVLVLNPDVVLLPGSLEAMLAAAEGDGVGAVAPRASVDPLGRVLLPRNAPPTPAEFWRTLCVHASPACARAYSRARLERNLEWWTRASAFDAEQLSGACLLLPRAACARAAGSRADSLFDERFPLYFEDTDLCRRLRAAGLRLVQEPRARIVHHWARSTGLDFSAETQRRYAVGLERYARKWHGALGAHFCRVVGEHLRGLAPVPMHAFQELGPLERAPRWAWPGDGPFVLELALAPSFLLTAGVLGTGDACELPEPSWEWLFAARYWARAVERASGALLGAWTFTKTTPARAQALGEEERCGAPLPEAVR